MKLPDFFFTSSFRPNTRRSRPLFSRPRLLLFVLLASSVALLADVKLTFDVTRHITKPAQPPLPAAAPVAKKSTVTILLGEDYLRSSSESETTHVDFVRRRTHHLSPDGKSFTDDSLYADIGFRGAELRNRQKIAAALSSATTQKLPDALDPFFAAHSLSLRLPESPPLIPSVDAGETSYAHDGKLLAVYSSDGFALTETEAARFARYLRHQVRAHPDILSALEKLRTVPRQFSVVQYDTGVDRSDFTLIASERINSAEASAATPTNLVERPTDSPALRSALALTPATFKARCDDSRIAAIEAGKGKQFLDALLLFLEFNLSTGEPIPKEFQTYKAAIEADPDCRIFFSTRRPASAAEARRAVEALHGLEAKTTRGLPVLQILRANLLTQLGQAGDAQPLFLAALESSPHIVGAWRDIGFGYHGGYRMDLAWQWWDAARRLLPASKTVKPIDDFERKLAHDHPEFF